MKTTQKAERRRHKRYSMTNRMIAMVRSDSHQLEKIHRMSKGEIAMAVIKSKPQRMGEILEISRGGLSFRHIENDADISQFQELDILFTDDDFHLTRLPFYAVVERDVKSDAPFDVLTMKQLAVQFKPLSDRQQRQLDQLLERYTSQKKGKQVWGSSS
ncbi:MAG: PilZ domain-containing protein [Desulfatitalea sp.]|nr:PilZ domain-containing protein [Desulfatitalea sp.]NNK01865.1 PilZ domain-containing protein [Desulfatitalea sp.]